MEADNYYTCICGTRLNLSDKESSRFHLITCEQFFNQNEQSIELIKVLTGQFKGKARSQLLFLLMENYLHDSTEQNNQRSPFRKGQMEEENDCNTFTFEEEKEEEFNDYFRNNMPSLKFNLPHLNNSQSEGNLRQSQSGVQNNVNNNDSEEFKLPCANCHMEYPFSEIRQLSCSHMLCLDCLCLEFEVLKSQRKCPLPQCNESISSDTLLEISKLLQENGKGSQFRKK